MSFNPKSVHLYDDNFGDFSGDVVKAAFFSAVIVVSLIGVAVFGVFA